MSNAAGHGHILTRMKNMKNFEAINVMTIRRRVIFSAAIFLFSLAIELFIALPHLLQSMFYGVPATTSISELLPLLGSSDAGSYLTAAVDLQDGSITPENQWILNLWPPGMPVLLAVMIKVTGGASPIVPMVILICCLWSLVLVCVSWWIIPRQGYLTLAVFAGLWIGSPAFTAWTTNNGVLGSDGLATAISALVAIGLISVGGTATAGKTRWVLFALLGMGLALLAYLRIIWFYAVPTALGVLACIVAIRLIILWLSRRAGSPRRDRRRFIEWGVLAAVFLATCAPWTIFVGHVLHPGDYSWSQSDYQWAHLWMSDEYLVANGAGFLETGGANWPCHIAAERCKQLADIELSAEYPYDGIDGSSFDTFRSEALATAYSHPVQFISDRTDFTLRTWLSTPGNAVGGFDNLFFGSLSLVLFLASVGILIRDSIRRRAGSLLIFLLLGANIGVLWLTHFETRYVIPLQGISLVVCALWASKIEGRLWRRRPTGLHEGRHGRAASL